jgi:hypothetical protein
MLVLTVYEREPNNSKDASTIVLQLPTNLAELNPGDLIVISVEEVRHKKVRLGIQAADCIKIDRQKIFEQKQREGT